MYKALIILKTKCLRLKSLAKLHNARAMINLNRKKL